MANLTGMPTYQNFVRQLETTDPKHPDTWNPNYQALINNDVFLKQKVDESKSDINDLTQQLDDLETSDPVEIKNAVNLDWLYNQNRIAFELFSSTYTQMDIISPVGGVSTVEGDDSVDIADTSSLIVGHEYVIFDDVNSISVVVAEIFTSTRFRASAVVGTVFENASLASTDFTITGGIATANNGGQYFAKPVTLDNEVDAAVIIRHNGQAGDLKLYYIDNNHAAWTEAYWKWQRDIETGIIDVEYLLPARGYFSLKLVCEAAEPVEIRHMVGVTGDTALEGAHHAPEKPVNSYPANEATDITETPVLAATGYTSLVGSDQWAHQFQVSTSETVWEAPSLVHDSGEKNGGIDYAVSAGILSVSTTYYFRMRFEDIEGAWSDWSAPTYFEMAETYAYVDTPANQSPANNAVDIPEQPSLSTSLFDTTGFPLISLSDGSSNYWTDSPTTPGEYYYTGALVNFKPMAVYAGGSPITEGTLGSLANGEWAWGDQDTLGADTIYMKMAAGDPDGQAADYAQCSESHAKSRWQIRTAAENYTAPLYDSNESDDLESHVVPAGNLEDGETDCYFRASHKGDNLGWSEYSQETKFTTKDVFANIIGIALVSSGGGAGTWQRVDGDGNNKSTDPAFFNNHPVYGAIDDATIDSQAMVKIPKFYHKVGNAPAGSDQAGKKCWWISNLDVEGFELYPAFMDAGVAIDQFYVGKYEATNDGGTKAGSASGVAPLVSINFPTMQTRCTARNTGGVEGFRMWNIYDLGAIQMLCLIENGGPDVQPTIGAGNTSGSAVENTGSTNAVWRGIYELWGNVYHTVDGLRGDTTNQIKIFDRNGYGTYIATGITATSTDGWLVSMHDDNAANYDLRDIFLGKTVDTTEGNSTFADYQSAFDRNDNVVYHGGRWGYGSYAGLFCLGLNVDASYYSAIYGSRLAKR